MNSDGAASSAPPTSQSLPKVAFILSSDRSGSTWAGYVLGSLETASFLGEFWRIWDDSLRRPCAWCFSHGLPSCHLLTGLEQHSPQRGYEVALCRTSSRLLVDNSKRISWARQFAAPNSHFEPFFIHLMRDPRGWYASERRRRQGSCEQMIASWSEENWNIKNFIEFTKVPSITVFYDELAQTPVPEFSRLCDALGQPFQPSALRYWEKTHHSLAANGASFALLNKAPRLHETDFMITGDDDFYLTKACTNFSDERWKQVLLQEESQRIAEDASVCGLLECYGRVLTSDGLHRRTEDDRSLHCRLDGKFVRTLDNSVSQQKIYFVRQGIRHWVTTMEFIQRMGVDRPRELEILPLSVLETIPLGLPIFG